MLKLWTKWKLSNEKKRISQRRVWQVATHQWEEFSKDDALVSDKAKFDQRMQKWRELKKFEKSLKNKNHAVNALEPKCSYEMFKSFYYFGRIADLRQELTVLRNSEIVLQPFHSQIRKFWWLAIKTKTSNCVVRTSSTRLWNEKFSMNTHHPISCSLTIYLLNFNKSVRPP